MATVIPTAEHKIPENLHFQQYFLSESQLSHFCHWLQD